MKLSPMSLIAFVGLLPNLAHSADTDTLMSLRDAIAPQECSLSEDIESQPFGSGTLYQIPCRATIADMLYVMILETETGLTPLFFPLFGTSLEADPDTGGAPFQMQTGRIGVTPIISSPDIRADVRTISTRERIAPGVADGHFSTSYQVNGFGPELLDAYVDIQGQDRMWIWPIIMPPKDLHQEIGLSHDLGVFRPLDTPQITLVDPKTIATHLDLDFPSVEEGHPYIDIKIEQEGNSLAANVISAGWADDSVAGEVFRVLMEKHGDLWRVTGLGVLTICGRGDKRLTDGRCP